MQYQFSSAAERVLLYATGCTSCADYAELAAPALLLGLLAESECRAALMLAGHGITPESVYKNWPKLLMPSPNRGISTAPLATFPSNLNQSLQIVIQLVAEYISPPILETEHILLSLLLDDGELSHWLNRQGVRSEDVQADIRKRHGYREGPLPLEPELIDKTEEELQIENCMAEEDSREQEDPSASDLPPPASSLQPSSLIPHPCFRVIDAAANRAREGLRVAEDFVRFVLDDRHLTGQCKQLRHDLAALMDQIPGEQLLSARETQADVGTALATPSEVHRSDAAEVLLANFARLQESLRSLEEFGKLIDPGWAAEIKQLRYRSYTLHRAVEITRTSIKRLANARLYVLIDGRATIDDFRQLAQSLIDAGVHLLQLRDKKLDDRQLVERARLLRELTRGTSTLFIINDRPDLAALCHADGVHLGQEDLSIKDARAMIGPEALVGISTHTIEQARQAVLDGANYIGAGPTFPTDTKKFENFPGLDFLRAVAAEICLPAFAIGGINPANLCEVLSTGITLVAISRSITEAPDPAVAARIILTKCQSIEL
jgi:thiamine-phosphate pyrophosphorylase